MINKLNKFVWNVCNETKIIDIILNTSSITRGADSLNFKKNTFDTSKSCLSKREIESRL